MIRVFRGEFAWWELVRTSRFLTMTCTTLSRIPQIVDTREMD